jgi:peptide deformylase
MSVRPIIRYPDPRLSSPCERVETFDASLAALCQDLLDTMRAAPGIGIAGPHIGVLKRVIVIQLSADLPVWTCINPEVIASSSVTVRHAEGSISLPGLSEEIERPDKVTVRYHDLAGAEHTIEASGMLGVCLQHEIDQLDGIFWLKRLSRLKRDRVLKRFHKIKAATDT